MVDTEQANHPTIFETALAYALTIGVGTAVAFTYFVPEESVIFIEVKAVAHRFGGAEGGVFWRAAAFRREAGGVPVQIGSTQSVVPDTIDADLLGSTVQFVGVIVGGGAVVNAIEVTLRSASANSYTWHCSSQADLLSDTG